MPEFLLSEGFPTPKGVTPPPSTPRQPCGGGVGTSREPGHRAPVMRGAGLAQQHADAALCPAEAGRPRSTDLENCWRQPATAGGAQAWCLQDLTGSAEGGPSPPPAACRAGAQGLMRKPPRAPTCPAKERELLFKGWPWVSGWNRKAAP